MIHRIELKEFMRTGHFGECKEIHFEMKREKLIQLLGESKWKHFSRKKSKYPSIYKYGKVEFYFEEGENGRLYGIQIQPMVQEADLLNLKINYEFIDSKSDFNSIIKYLEEVGISYTKLDFEFDSDDVQRLKTEGGVQIIFLKDDFNKSFSLQKINKFKYSGILLNINFF